MKTNADDVARAISKILHSRAEKSEAGFYSFSYMNSILPEVSPERMEEAVSAIDSFDEIDDTCIVAKTSYEILVVVNSPFRSLARQLDNVIGAGGESSEFTYNVGAPSAYYAIYLWLKLEMQKSVLLHNVSRHPPGTARQEKIPDIVESVWDAVRYASRLRTLRVEARKPQRADIWQDHVNSFIFQVGYNFGIPVLLDKDLRSLSHAPNRQKPWRSSRNDLDVPRRIYIPDLIYHYQLGISSVGSPMLQYLSYYHVAEHWFEIVFEDDLVRQVQDRITGPSFSYKRQRDIAGLIKMISRSIHMRNERLVIDELTALRLTIERYVDLDELSSELRNFDPDLLDYYADHEVEFCSGNTVDFDLDEAKVMKALANRIYKTRNALAHSKDGARGKYTPFVDDGKLIPEVPLMRFIAEQIVIATSELMD